MSTGRKYAIVGMAGFLGPFMAIGWVDAAYGFCLWLGWPEELAAPFSVISSIAAAISMFISVVMIYEKSSS